MAAAQSFTNSFARGFGLMDSHYARKKQNERLDRQEGREEERYQFQKDQLQQQKQQQEAQQKVLALKQLDKTMQELPEDDPGRQAYMEEVRNVSQQLFGMAGLNPAIFVSDIGDSVHSSTKKLMETGDIRQAFGSRESRARAGEMLYGHRVRAKGADKPARSGKPRKSQEVYDVIPLDEEHLGLMTRVDDGDEVYGSAVTEGGLADSKKDPNMKKLPTQGVMDHLEGAYSLRLGLEGEGLMPLLRAAYATAGGKPSDFDPPATNTQIVGGEEDSYLVDKSTGKTTPLGVGTKKGRGQRAHTEVVDGKVVVLDSDGSIVKTLGDATKGGKDTKLTASQKDLLDIMEAKNLDKAGAYAYKEDQELFKMAKELAKSEFAKQKYGSKKTTTEIQKRIYGELKEMRSKKAAEPTGGKGEKSKSPTIPYRPGFDPKAGKQDYSHLF